MPPDPPDDVPTYVADGLARQDVDTLRSIVEYCRERIDYLESSIEDDEITVDGDEELVTVDEASEPGTIVVKRVPCGKDCGGCPHGPYRYRVTRDGDDLNWEYLGKAETE